MAKRKLNLLWGSDPEMGASYVRDGNMYILPPYFFRKYRGVPVELDENHPTHPVFLRGDGWMVHEDGAAFEMAVTPSENFRDLWERIQQGAAAVGREILSQFPDDCEKEIQFLPTMAFDVPRWAGEGEDFIWATRFGCDPQRDAFDYSREDSVVDASQHPWRYLGGHMHVSGCPSILDDVVRAIQIMAITAGCAGIAYSDVPNLENLRLFKYGLPGTFRVQDYGEDNPFGKDYRFGVEYRTISARWAGNWNLAENINRWMEIGIRNLVETKLGDEILQEYRNHAVSAILQSDQELAMEVLQAVEARL